MLNVLVWHVHGSWTTAFVHGPHRYLVPTVPGRGPEGRGRASTYCWPDRAVEVTPEEVADLPVDVVVVQRPDDEALARAWLGGRRPGRDVPLVWVEHNAPQGRIDELRHPAADRDDVVLVHVSPTNALFWDSGTTTTRVVEHGVVDPGHRYRGELARAAVVVNEPVRRARVAGTDLLPALAAAVPLDLFGMVTDAVPGAVAAARHDGHGDGDDDRDGGLSRSPIVAYGDVPQAVMHDEVARRRVYLHPYRWTSLGLSRLEAMLLGLPVVAVGTLEVPFAVPGGAGVVSTRPDELAAGLRRLVADPDAARTAGEIGRRATLERYGLERFLADWDELFADVVR